MKLPAWLSFGRQKGAISVPTLRDLTFFAGPVVEGFAGAFQRSIVAESKENLLKFSPVYAAVSRISRDVSILRPMLMQPGPGTTTVEVKDAASPYMPLIKRPNPYQNWIQFLEYWIICKLLFGNSYAIKERDRRGIVVGLYPVDPRLARPMIAPDGEVYYAFSRDDLARIPDGADMLPAEEVVHDRMCTLWHPLVGVPPIYAAAASGTHGIRIQTNAETFFKNMSRPSGILSHPQTVSPEQLKLLKQQMEEGFSGANLGRLMVTGGGATYTAMSVAAEQSQLVEQLKWTVEDVARCFHLPLHKLQTGQMPTFSNIGVLNTQYYDEALKPHIEAFERLMTDEVVMKNEYSLELDLSGLLRMDPKTRAETREIDMRAGALMINEGRAQENRPPVPGGNTTYLQQQNYSLEALAKRDAQDDPFGTAKPEPTKPSPSEDEDATVDDTEDTSEEDMAKMMAAADQIERLADMHLRHELGMHA